MSKEPKAPHQDWAVIEKLGGPRQVADLLRYTGAGRVQRVQNWKFRGIPELERLRRPEVFRLPQSGEVDQQQAAVGGA